MTRNLTTTLLMPLFFVWSACQNGGLISSTISGTTDADPVTVQIEDPSASTSETTAPTPDSGEVKVGTSSGNPTLPVTIPSRQLIFKKAELDAVSQASGTATESNATNSSTDSTTDSDTSTGSDTSDQVSQGKCVLFGKRQDLRPAATQHCSAAAYTYNLGVIQIDAMQCTDEEHPDRICAAQLSDGVVIEPIFAGDLVNVKITAEKTIFPAELIPLTRDMSLGAVRITMAYFELVIPTPEEDAQQAALYAPALHGAHLRYCTTPDESVDSDVMLKNCGNAEARKGDMLVDLNGDGLYGFIDLTTLTPDFIGESPRRPKFWKDSGFHQDDFIDEEAGIISLSYTMGKNRLAIGYLAAMHFPAEIISLSATSGYALEITFDIRRTLAFIDGARGKRPICVEAVLGETCPGGDDDPGSPGQYNPFYDGRIVPRVPLTVVETAE